MEPTALLNVGGVHLEIPFLVLSKYPTSRLYSLASQAPSKKHPVYLDLNPIAFLAVLDYIRTGQALLPLNVSHELFLLIAKELGIPVKEAIVAISTNRSFELENSELPEYEAVSSDLMTVKTQLLVHDRLIPLINSHAKQGHLRLRVYILPRQVESKEISSDTSIGHESYPVAFLSLKTDPSLPDIDCLQQPEIRNLITSTLKSRCAIKLCETDLQQITIRKTNDFGLYESSNEVVVRVTVQII